MKCLLLNSAQFLEIDLTGVEERMKKGQTDTYTEKLNWVGCVLSNEIQQEPGTSVCLFCTSELRRWDFGTKLNKGAGLANLG